MNQVLIGIAFGVGCAWGMFCMSIPYRTVRDQRDRAWASIDRMWERRRGR